MRKTMIAASLTTAAALLVPMTGTAYALQDANTYGTTSGNAKITRTSTATCNPMSGAGGSDLLCREFFSGKFQNNNETFGRNHGTFFGNVTINFAFAAVQRNCASASGRLILRVYNKDNQYIGNVESTLRPATAENPDGSKVCKSGSPADSDVSSTFFVGDLSGNISSFPVCGVSEDRGTSIQKRTPQGQLVEKFRVASNTQADLKVGEACSNPG